MVLSIHLHSGGDRELRESAAVLQIERTVMYVVVVGRIFLKWKHVIDE